MVNVKDANEILNDKVDINKLEFKADLFRFRLFAINKAKQFIERIIWLDIDWKYIIDNGMKYKKNNELQSSFLKYYEKIMIKTDYAVEPNIFCPIHWAWAKDIFTNCDVDKKMKYGLKPVEYIIFKNNDKILGIHLWRQLLKKHKWRITNNSIYNRLKKIATE